MFRIKMIIDFKRELIKTYATQKFLNDSFYIKSFKTRLWKYTSEGHINSKVFSIYEDLFKYINGSIASAEQNIRFKILK